MSGGSKASSIVWTSGGEGTERGGREGGETQDTQEKYIAVACRRQL